MLVGSASSLVAKCNLGCVMLPGYLPLQELKFLELYYFVSLERKLFRNKLKMQIE